MNYFVNENIFTLNSGTEFSAVKRLELFRGQDVPAKLLTRNYNSQLMGDLKRVGLTHADVVNMYDYFQEITEAPEEDIDVRYAEVIDKFAYHIEGVDANESLIKYHGRTVGKVQIAPATVGLVGSIEYYTDMGTVASRDIWDRRGFKSSTQYFHPDGSMGPQVFFDREGTPKIEITHMNINGQLAPTMYKLLDYKGRARRFNSEHELFVFFMNELAALEPTVFINDRPSLTQSVAEVTGATGKWQYLHNVHAKNNEQVGASRNLVDYLKPLFNQYAAQFDGILVATDQQKDEIQKVFHFKQVLAVPDTFAAHVTEPKADARDKNKIVYLGRMADDKGSMDTLEILRRVHVKLPEARIEYYGYASPADIQDKLVKQAEQYGLKDFAVFKGYQDPAALAETLTTASLLINTSSGEGFGMNVLEAMAAGVPALAYNVKYGLTELIENGVDGVLVARGNIRAAADAIVSILSDDDKRKSLSVAAYKKAQSFDATASWGKWANAAVAAQNLFVK